MSADDIQKAKLRALYMQSKHGRKSSLPNGSNSMNNEAVNKGQGVLLGNSSQVSKVVVEPKDEELKEPVLTAVKVTDKGEDHHHATEAKMELKVSIQKLESEVPVTEKEPKVPVEKMESKVPVGQLHSRVQIPWQSPPEVRLNLLWRVGTGEFSKEVEVQKNRNRREMEIIYRVAKEIPSNPKEPWDLDMDYDDSLTPEIPIEQQPDAADGTEKTEVPDDNEPKKSVAASSSSSSPAGPTIVAQNGDGGGPAAEPDLELLAVLLKNPQLVFALTSGQAGNLSNDETMKLLDMIKSGGSSIVGSSSSSSVNESGGGKVERAEVVEVSLPSPTPSSSNPRTVRHSGPCCKFCHNFDISLVYLPPGSNRLFVIYTVDVIIQEKRTFFLSSVDIAGWKLWGSWFMQLFLFGYFVLSLFWGLFWSRGWLVENALHIMGENGLL
ncbi:unnamed protein product [Linum tenue]|nr:unnamed protein product [Linum tenue]